MQGVLLKTSVLILAMLLIRKLFWKACNPNVIYFLWLFVAIRILVPFNVPLTVHQDFLNDMLIGGQQFVATDLKTGESSQEKKAVQKTSEHKVTDDGSFQEDGLPANNNMPTDNSMQTDNNMQTDDSDKKLTAVNNTVQRKNIDIVIWLTGSILLAVYLMVVNIVTYCNLNKTKTEITEDGIQIYEAPGCSCLLGLFKPRILLDSIILDNPKYKKYVLLHEIEHYRTKDNFWLLVKNICLVIQWINPLVWLAYFKVQEDCELACDNRVLSHLNENEKKDYAETLLKLLEMKKTRVSFAASAVNGRTIMEKRIKCIFEKKRVRSLVFVLAFMGMIAVTTFIKIDVKGEMPLLADRDPSESLENADITDVATILYVENAAHMGKNDMTGLCYSTDIYRAGNHYWIDENDTLWGTGYSDYGQLGELREDLSYSSEPKRIAENAVHVDYSGEYFMIYLTKDNRLYGLGGNPCGILRETSMNDYNGRDMNVITEPVLLMENVVYARCGYSTIIALTDNGDVYVLGNNDENAMINEAYHGAVKVMENARYVASYFRTYAVISNDDSLWTWGDNRIGQCGVGKFSDYVEEPQRVLEDVKCVWMGRTGFNGGNVLAEQDNLIVLKNDGDYYACGEGISGEIIKDRTEGLDNEHLALANDINASAKLQKVVIKEYESVSLANVEFFWTEAELISFLEQHDIDYYKEFAEDTSNPVYLANKNQWEFVFDGAGRLVMISDMKSDEFEGNSLSCGDNMETVISEYGNYDRKHDTEYEYFELEYDRNDYIFKVGIYDKFGCAKFSKCVKEYGAD